MIKFYYDLIKLDVMLQLPRKDHVTLPSVSNAFGTMKIPKAPPKAVFAPYRQKVFDNNDILNIAANSFDRLSEMISPYSRGQNPMVSVDYSDRSGTMYTKSPYKIMVAGAFRPPIITREQQEPLSRQSRKTTAIRFNPGIDKGFNSATFQENLGCEKLKGVREELLSVCAGTNKVYNKKTVTPEYIPTGYVNEKYTAPSIRFNPTSNRTVSGKHDADAFRSAIITGVHASARINPTGKTREAERSSEVVLSRNVPNHAVRFNVQDPSRFMDGNGYNVTLRETLPTKSVQTRPSIPSFRR